MADDLTPGAGPRGDPPTGGGRPGSGGERGGGCGDGGCRRPGPAGHAARPGQSPLSARKPDPGDTGPLGTLAVPARSHRPRRARPLVRHRLAGAASHPRALQLERPVRRRQGLLRDRLVRDRLPARSRLARPPRLIALRLRRLSRAGLAQRPISRRARRRPPALRLRRHRPGARGPAQSPGGQRREQVRARPGAHQPRPQDRALLPGRLSTDRLRLFSLLRPASARRAGRHARDRGSGCDGAHGSRRRGGDRSTSASRSTAAGQAPRPWC